MAAFLASDNSAYTTGTIVTVDGGGNQPAQRALTGEHMELGLRGRRRW